MAVPLIAGALLWASGTVGQAPNPFRGQRLYVNPESPALRQAAAWARSRPADAAHMRRIGEQPQAIWLGDWTRDIRAEVDRLMTQIGRAGALPVFVAYNIPNRDCGLYSAGGARGGDAYRRWVQDFARGLRGRRAVVILEPDGLASMDCMPARLRDERSVLLREAVQTLTAGGAAVYIDAGNANWKQPADMAARLRGAGIDRAQGFALNVSNFHNVQVNLAYGDRLSAMVGGKHYVIDTSRNGRGAQIEREWCNAPGQALGRAPTANTGNPRADAFLWVKMPGQSDGTCNGGPRAGAWWPDYALELSRAAAALGSMFPR
ncbi:MAG TPA: glycoside hydrolase family 6 protein [Longimicrobium sp.]|jgi:endoglucanase|uniref:glycoside hydrolase family 6 protein n=1 Tax=Longimicrobium sp. TaxID=2029185 RepID=UPI002EDA7276